jgi:hypothetical protein
VTICYVRRRMCEIVCKNNDDDLFRQNSDSSLHFTCLWNFEI